ncbi:CHASE3 domain-containing protein [Arenibaculum pallidiluteum]|uniref:CHASE3 domain-containing protein n=1 Tax=Arenibaculum pallidiluteum TaxID=2812559 RepID=UPI001A9782FD|nr:CHASE3 domain-containing protein [Arenibaculum pallidiluteum]
MTIGKWSIGRLEWVVVLPLVLLLAAATFNAGHFLAEYRRARGAVEQGQEILEAVADVRADLGDLETGQRGYLLTLDPTYLEPYEARRRRLPDELLRLQALVGGDPDQVRRAAALRAAAESKADELAETIAAVRLSGLEKALDIVRTGKGGAAMREFRAIADEIADTANMRLSRDRDRGAVAESRMLAAGAAAGFLSFLCIGLLGSHALRHFRAACASHGRERRSWEELRRSTELSRRMLNASADCVKLLDLDGRLISMNPGGCRLMEIDDLQPYVGADWFGFWTDGETRRLARQAFDEARAGRTGRFSGFCPTAKGTPRWWDVAISPVTEEDGTVCQLLSVSRDVTERMQAEQSQRESQGRLRAILETTPECVKLVGADGLLLQMNRVGLRIVEAESEDAVRNRPVLDLIAPEHRAQWLANHERVCRGEELSWEFDLLGLKGTRRHMETHAAPLVLGDGTRAQLAVTRDVTERRLLERQLKLARDKAEAAAQMKSRLLAATGHDLRQPLNVISMARDMLAPRTVDPTSSKYLAWIGEAVKQLARNLDDISDISRIESGALKPKVAPMRLDDVLDDVRGLFAPLAERKGISLRVLGCSAEVATDRDMLRRILENLISNAVKYTGSGGSVLVGVRRRGGALALQVLDTGAGIPADRLATAFDAYRRLDATTPGLGLGLSIVKQTADLLGHRVDARSVLGRGSCFTVELAADPAGSAARNAAPDTVMDAGRRLA